MPEKKEEVQTIVFGPKELDPEKEEAYRKKVETARKEGVSGLKGSTPLGHVPRPAIPFLQTERISELPSGLTPDGGVQPRPPGSPVIRPETAQQITEMQKAQTEAEKIEANTKEEIDREDVRNSILDKMFESKDPDAVVRKVLDNSTRRKAIEARCSEMKIEDLILQGEVRQTITVIPNKLIIRLRSLLPEENLFIKEMMAKQDSVSDSHAIEMFSLFQIACSLISVNSDDITPLWPAFNKDGKLDEEAFNQRFKKIKRMSGYLINDIGINYYWFDIRVRKLLNPEALGNT